MAYTTQYIGSRYVPLFAEPAEWNSARTYEPLTIVMHEGNSYTSRQYVPTGIEITNEKFWALTGNYNAQIEQYRRETAAARETADEAQRRADAAQTDIDTLLPKSAFSAENTVKDYIDSFMTRYTVANDYAGLLKTTDDLVLVLHNDSPIGNGNMCLYEKTERTFDTYTREDGSHIKACAGFAPQKDFQAPASRIGDVAASYIGVSSLTYGNEHTLFNDVCTNEIDCSAFVSAVLYGITYENSRYSNGTSNKNVISDYCGSNKMPTYDPTYGQRSDSLLTWLMCEWFAENGRLFEFENASADEIAKLAPGCVLFSGDKKDNPNKVYAIDHCAMVLNVFPEKGLVLVAQCGGSRNGIYTYQNTVANLALIDLKNGINDGHYKVFARPMYAGEDRARTNLSGAFVSTGPKTIDGTGTTNLCQISVEKFLSHGRIYTLTVKGDLPNYIYDGCRCVCYCVCEDTSQNFIVANTIHIDTSNGVYSTSFVIPKTVTSRVVSMNLLINSNEFTGTPVTFEVTEYAIVDGIELYAEGSRTAKLTEINAAFGNNLHNRSFIKPSGLLVLSVDFPMSGLTGDVKIGHLSDVVKPQRNISVNGRIGTTDYLCVYVSANGDLMFSTINATQYYGHVNGAMWGSR